MSKSKKIVKSIPVADNTPIKVGKFKAGYSYVVDNLNGYWGLTEISILTILPNSTKIKVSTDNIPVWILNKDLENSDIIDEIGCDVSNGHTIDIKTSSFCPLVNNKSNVIESVGIKFSS